MLNLALLPKLVAQLADYQSSSEIATKRLQVTVVFLLQGRSPASHCPVHCHGVAVAVNCHRNTQRRDVRLPPNSGIGDGPRNHR